MLKRTLTLGFVMLVVSMFFGFSVFAYGHIINNVAYAGSGSNVNALDAFVGTGVWKIDWVEKTEERQIEVIKSPPNPMVEMCLASIGASKGIYGYPKFFRLNEDNGTIFKGLSYSFGWGINLRSNKQLQDFIMKNPQAYLKLKKFDETQAFGGKLIGGGCLVTLLGVGLTIFGVSRINSEATNADSTNDTSKNIGLVGLTLFIAGAFDVISSAYIQTSAYKYLLDAIDIFNGENGK